MTIDLVAMAAETGIDILLVEDNPDDVELTLLAFKKTSSESTIHVVGDGQAALDYLMGEGAYAERAGLPLPSVVLLDLNLPKVCGIDVLRTLRAKPRTRRLPVVVLTSSREEVDVAGCYDGGANS
jgi:two-component system response regulator